MTVVQRVFKDLPQKPGGLNAIQQSPYNKCPKATYAIVLVFQWTKILKYIVYTGPSIKKGKKKKEGYSMGDDICE